MVADEADDDGDDLFIVLVEAKIITMARIVDTIYSDGLLDSARPSHKAIKAHNSPLYHPSKVVP